MRITMPQLGESVVEGIIARWLKREGDRIEKYEALVEVTTEKVNVEVPSPAAGVITRLTVAEGATVPVGEEIAVVEEGATSAPIMTDRQPAPAGVAVSRGAPPVPLAQHVPEAYAVQGNGNAHPTGPQDSARRYTPVVQRMAEHYQIDLTQVPGTGNNGRVTKEDVQRYLDEQAASPPVGLPSAGTAAGSLTPLPTASPTAVQPPAMPDGEVVPLTPMRRAIAENMQRSASTIPAAWTMLEVDVTGLVRLRERIKAEFSVRHGVDLTYLPFTLQAVIVALREYPAVNAVWGGDHILMRKRINLGVAVSIADGLLVPVIRDADGLNLVGLARSCAGLVQKARDNRLSVSDMEGATFTVNNPGTFGSIASQPIIPPGQGAILNVESIVKRPVVRDDMIAIRSMLNLCISFDHRILDGRDAIGFLQAVRRRLEAWGPDSPIE